MLHIQQDKNIQRAMASSQSVSLNAADSKRAHQQIEQVKNGNYTQAFKDEYKSQMHGVRDNEGKIILHGNTKME